MEFTHLHTHSHYSLLDGLSKIDQLVEKAKEENMKALALTDHGVMYGVIEFYQKCRAAGIKPIIGVETYISPNGRFKKRTGLDEKRYHLVLLAKNKTGYQNLIKLITKAHLEGFYYKPRIDWEILEEYSNGLIALTACLQGEVPNLIIHKEYKKAEKTIEKFIRVFGKGNVYLEIQYHSNIPEQEVVNRQLAEYSEKFNLPLIATNDIHYTNPEDDEAQDVLLCLQTKKKKEDKDRMCMLGEDFSFKSTKQMISEFKEYPEAIKNTQKVVAACNLEIELGKIALPHYSVPDNQTIDEHLKDLCYQGLEKRYGKKAKSNKKILDRLEYELKVIKDTGFASYFLIVQDFVNWAKSNSIVVGPGRGSAAGSIVSYLINITNIDPLKYDLLFERFLNPERAGGMPDIDLDFTDTRRNEVIKYVEGRYGRDHVSQIITFGTMAARAAIRDVGRVLGFQYNYCDKVAKLIPMFMNLDKALATVPELKEILENDSEGRRLIEIAKKLEGVSRHASTHACGVLITREPSDNYVPLQYASSSDQTIVSQYSLHPIEDLGLLKMDFLGLKNLTVLEDTIEIISKTRREEINIDEIPLDDKKTFSLFKRGETTGVFQLESGGMRRYLKQLKPTEFEDIIAMVALYRPGPMELIPDYIAGKHGKKKTVYLHPKLKPILEKTYGVAVYQEQVLQIARDLAGFTLGEADILRKAVGKKIKKLMNEQKKKFIGGCVANGIEKRLAEKIFEFIEPFAGYGFNRAHAACYAMIAYQTAYFKANYTSEFMAALLTSDHGNTDRIAIQVAECEQLGIEVLPPDINESYTIFTVVKDAKQPTIRFGLNAIKNVGTNIVKTIIHERKKSGPYKTLEDFLMRVQTKDLNKKSLESLVKCGALDKLGERNQMLMNMERLLTYARNAQREQANGQTNLFGSLLSTTNRPNLRLEKTEIVSKKQKLAWEKELLGLYVSEHPFEEFEGYLKRSTVSYTTLKEYLNKGTVKVAGVITNIKKIITRSGEPMLFVKIEDAMGRLEILVFPKILKNNQSLWQEDKPILVSGRVSDKDGEIKLLCDQAEELTLEKAKGKSESFSQAAKAIFVNLPFTISSQVADELKSILKNFPGPHKVYLMISKGSEAKKIETSFSIDYNQKVKEVIEETTGSNTVRLISLI